MGWTKKNNFRCFYAVWMLSPIVTVSSGFIYKYSTLIYYYYICSYLNSLKIVQFHSKFDNMLSTFITSQWELFSLVFFCTILSFIPYFPSDCYYEHVRFIQFRKSKCVIIMMMMLIYWTSFNFFTTIMRKIAIKKYYFYFLFVSCDVVVNSPCPVCTENKFWDRPS